MGQRVRVLIGLWAVVELAIFVLLAAWIGLGWTILATLATSAVGLLLLGRQGTRALHELAERARAHEAPGRALGDAGLVAAGGGLMLLPGFLGDVVGLLCLLPATRPLPRALIGRLLWARLPVSMRGPVHVRSSRSERVDGTAGERVVVIDGEVATTQEPDGGTAGPLQIESHRLDQPSG